MTRDPSIYLAPSEPRCNPIKHCPDASTCARALATIPQGTPLASRDPAECKFGSWTVSYYISVSQARKALKGAPVRKPALPW